MLCIGTVRTSKADRIVLITLLRYVRIKNVPTFQHKRVFQFADEYLSGSACRPRSALGSGEEGPCNALMRWGLKERARVRRSLIVPNYVVDIRFANVHPINWSIDVHAATVILDNRY